MDRSPYLTPDEAADWLRVSRPTLYAYIKAGLIPSVKIGGSRRISVQALEEALSRLAEPVK
jgi:excisionase family DNA binding protein